jgi:hypothetical protein
MWRPRPTPPKRRVDELSTWRNMSKITGTSAGAMPIPVSRTASVSRPASTAARTSTLPFVVNLSALPTRFLTIVFTFMRSVTTVARGGRDEPAERHVGLDERLELAIDLRADVLHVDRSDVDRLPSRLEPAEVERRVHEVEQLEGALPDARDRVVLVGREDAERPLREQVGVPRDDVQRRPQLVRHRRDELRLEPAGALQVVDQTSVLERDRGSRSRCRARVDAASPTTGRAVRCGPGRA